MYSELRSYLLSIYLYYMYRYDIDILIYFGRGSVYVTYKDRTILIRNYILGKNVFSDYEKEFGRDNQFVYASRIKTEVYSNIDFDSADILILHNELRNILVNSDITSKFRHMRKYLTLQELLELKCMVYNTSAFFEIEPYGVSVYYDMLDSYEYPSFLEEQSKILESLEKGKEYIVSTYYINYCNRDNKDDKRAVIVFQCPDLSYRPMKIYPEDMYFF